MSPRDLIRRLRYSPFDKEKISLGRSLACQGVLYSELRQVIHARPLPHELERNIEKCWSAIGESTEIYDRMKALVWCAKIAQSSLSDLPNQTDYLNIANEFDSNSPFLKNRGKEWLTGTILSFLPTTTWTETEVWVALYNKDLDSTEAVNENTVGLPINSNSGVLARLHLEVCNTNLAPGIVFQHPIDTFSKFGVDQFIPSMGDAWTAARDLVYPKNTPENTNWIGRWRLLNLDGQPLPDVGGRSASGAAALGWYNAFRSAAPDKKRSLPDDRIIVIAEVDEKPPYELKEVDGVQTKVQAIRKAVEEGKALIDTIVVAGDKNRREAEYALSNFLGRIRVKIPDEAD